MKNKLGTGWIIVTIALVLAMFLLVIPALSGIWSIADMPLRVCVALLGVGVTTLVTKVLLSSQSEGELKQAKSRKVFEEKMAIYKDFINFLYEVVKDGQLTKEEKLELQFQTSLVIMHCLPKNIGDISTAIGNILKTTCPQDEDKNWNSNPTKSIMLSLIGIVKVLRKDLYREEIDVEGDVIEEICEAFDNAKEADSPIQNTAPIIVPASPTPPAHKKEEASLDVTTSTPSDVILWNDAVMKWQEDGWQVDGDADAPGCLAIYSEGLFGQSRENVYIKVGYLAGEYYYIEAKYMDYRDFSQPLKWEYSGRRQKGLWYKPLDEPYCNLPEGTFAATLANDAGLQQHLISWVETLQPILQQFHLIARWEEEAGPRDGWKLILWYWTILGCEYDNQDEGTPYFDVRIGDKIEFQLSNRQGDRDKLKKTLARIGMSGKSIDDDIFVCLETLPVDSTEVVEKIHYWMQKIDEKV